MKLIDAFKYIIGIALTCFGWFISTTLTEIKSDIKILLEDKAAKTEQIRALERAAFGKITAEIDMSFSSNQNPHFYNMIFDKTKTLKYENEHFIYS